MSEAPTIERYATQRAAKDRYRKLAARMETPLVGKLRTLVMGPAWTGNATSKGTLEWIVKFTLMPRD